MSKATIGAVGSYSLNGGFRIDGAVTQWWATKTQARAAAKAIGWPMFSVQPCYTRFQKGWALGWGMTKPGLVSKEEFKALSAHLKEPR